ncbi:MAG: DUF6572 domain-containing protein [Thermoanaerobaculia bacterium]
MTVEQPDEIDIVGIERNTGLFVLTIADHLDWDELEEHMRILEAKVESYIAFIDSGHVLEEHPLSAGRGIAISLVFRVTPPDSAATFFDRLRERVEGAGHEIRTMTFPFAS